MSYYNSKTIQNVSFDKVMKRVIEALKQEGFGVLTEIDVKATMKKKLNIDYRPYMILGACNPPFAHKALMAENKIGTMLPCNVIVQEITDGAIEVSAVDPIASMMAVENEGLAGIATEINEKFKSVIAAL